jgi:hypothetical protein
MFGIMGGTRLLLTIIIVVILYLGQTNYGISEFPRLYSKKWRGHLFSFKLFLSRVVILPRS